MHGTPAVAVHQDGGKGGGAEAGLDSVSDVSSFSKNAKSQPPPRVKATKLSSLIASNRAMLRPIYLTFKQPDLENEYGKYFVKYNLARWQRSVTMLFCLLSILYLYLTIQYSLDSTFFQNNYARKTYTTLPAGLCPTGWYCAVCNPDMICTTYSIGFDIAFWIVAVFLPYVLGILASYHLTNSYFTEYNDLISSIVLAFMAFLGVGIRYYVVEQAASLIQPTLIMNLILLLAIYNLRIRFIYTVVTVWWIVILWIIINIPPLFTQQSPTHATGRTYAITFVTHIVTGVVLSLVAYETEYFHRMQFLMSKEMKKNNAKLTNQLKLLAKSYNKKAGSLDSPLERSVMVIRSVMADPVLSSQHLMALGQVLALLSSSNLLTPDLEGTLGNSLDNEQEAWLFSEIAARRRRGRAKSGGRRRPSMTMDIASKIEAPIAERSDALKEDTEQKETEGSVFAGVIGREEMRAPKQVVAEEPGAAYPPILDGVAALLSRAVEYNWPIFDLNAATHNNPLVVLSHHLFTTANLFEAFSIPRDKFRLFTKTIQKGYHADLPYHNSIHATDVLHCMSFLANDEKIKQVTSDIEVFSMYLAAMIHDHDHPGFNNNFLVNTFDPKAMLYNDKSVLENHHVASSFSVLMQPEYNFLSHLSKSDFKAIREIVVDLVLATDLTQHFTLLSMFKAKVASSETFDPYETREDRMLLYKIMMKCSDVSNPSKDMSLYEPWCRLIMDEFFLQGDMEKKLNLPVSPYMDRDNVNVPSSQIGFIDYVVMPLFDALDKFQPIPNILNRLQRNREYWAQLKAQGISHLPPLGSLLSASINAGTAQAKGAGVPRPSHTQSQVISGSKAALATAAKLPSNSPSASQQDGLGTGAEDDSEEVSPTDETA